ncbi:MAG: YicC/YloC family endoribonuclease [Candidatus Dasytiphilus stammeri]
MIRSMTAFTRNEIKRAWGHAVWEIRSVNQRYLETYLRIPESFRTLEPEIRQRISKKLTRGKIECFLRFDSNSQLSLNINKLLVQQLLRVVTWIQSQNNGQGIINCFDILRWPGVILTEKLDFNSIGTELLTVLDSTLDDLINIRELEGSSLKRFIEQRLINVSNEVAKVRLLLPDIIKFPNERLVAKVQEAKMKLEENIFFQDIMLIVQQRGDVSEELDRLETHINQIYHILNRKEAIGRRLDFIMQELNRESNTIASKSINSELTTSAIEIKVLIEQMREQIQNIE